MKNCDEVQKMIEDEECEGVKVTPENIKSRIQRINFKTLEICGQKFMFCGIKMDNGFTVVGRPATCMDPDNWRDSIGKKVSYDNTFSEIFKLEAYRKMSEQ